MDSRAPRLVSPASAIPSPAGPGQSNPASVAQDAACGRSAARLKGSAPSASDHQVPWDSHFDQALDGASCANVTDITANLTQRTNYSCLSAVDMGTAAR